MAPTSSWSASSRGRKGTPWALAGAWCWGLGTTWRASRQAVPGGGSQRRGRALNAPTDLRCSPPGRTRQLARLRALAQTVAMRMTKCAARTAPTAPLLGAPLKSPPPGTACRDAVCVVVVGSGSGLPFARACPARGRDGWLHRGGRNYSRMPHRHARQPRWSRQPHGALPIICAIGGRHGAAARRASPGRSVAPAVSAHQVT